MNWKQSLSIVAPDHLFLFILLLFFSQVSLIINMCCLVLQACYERGEEVVVSPKMSSNADSAWLSMAAYAWSGYVFP